MSKELVQVKIMKQVGQHKPGDVVAVTKEVADQLCAVSTVNLGEGKVAHHQKAMLHADYVEMLKKPPKAGGLTQGEMAEMGAKNIVETPTDDAFAKKLKKLQETPASEAPAAPAKAAPKASKGKKAPAKKAAAAAESAPADASSAEAPAAQ